MRACILGSTRNCLLEEPKKECPPFGPFLRDFDHLKLFESFVKTGNILKMRIFSVQKFYF